MRLFTTIKKRYQSSEIAQRIASGAFWSLTGTALAKLLVLISGILCARILTKEEYGEFGMVRSTINMFVVFGMAGIGLTATKYISEYRKTQQARISSIFLLTRGFSYITACLITVIIFLLSPFLAEKTLEAPQLTNSIRLGALLLFFTVLNAAQNGTLAGLEKFKAIALNTLKGSIAESALMILGAYYWSVQGAILGYGCGFLVLYICNQHSIRKSFAEMGIEIRRKDFDRGDLSLLYKFTLPAALSSFLVMPSYWIVRTILVRINGFEELAIYEAAEQWRIIILFIPTAVSQLVLPILSSLTAIDVKKFWRVLYLNLSLNAGIALVLAFAVSLTSGFIMKLYGNSYTNSWPLIILAFSTVFSTVAGVIGSSIASRAKMWAGFSFNFLWAVMLVLFTYLFSCYGATGNAFAILLAYAIHATLQFVYLLISRNIK